MRPKRSRLRPAPTAGCRRSAIHAGRFKSGQIEGEDTPSVPAGRSKGNGNGTGRTGCREARSVHRPPGSVATAPTSRSRKHPRDDGKDPRLASERSLHRLLAGLRAVNAGDFSVQLAPNGDPLHGRHHRRLQQRHAKAGAAGRRDLARQQVRGSRGQDARPRRDGRRRRPVGRRRSTP